MFRKMGIAANEILIRPIRKMRVHVSTIRKMRVHVSSYGVVQHPTPRT
jgi:hypothetical protein